ncbi:hypothetical protein LCI18_015241 [Fusarium solani-melongenae]|uniref:Uncharacterized protein n=1 Tax=Fusarium solani subsp. cucurbitae TaxID=2747967 RepID=A0ACD3ZSY4_FUSSC|nr:hypothetical protein LCI18_015241 [Fusarium solani-melongenae]
MGKLTDRQVALQNDGRTIRKSVRISHSSLNAEKRYLELVKANTSVPVPSVRHYYLSEEFEHLIMNKMPGMTLERAWPTLSPLERESIADEVASLVEQLRKLYYPCIKAALLQRQPFRAGLRDVTTLNMERIKKFLSNEHIVAYVYERSEAVGGDLKWALTPAGRDENRKTGWAEVVRILGPGVGEPPLVAYVMATEHPWWLESYMEVTQKADGSKASHLPLRDDAMDAGKSERN